MLAKLFPNHSLDVIAVSGALQESFWYGDGQAAKPGGVLSEPEPKFPPVKPGTIFKQNDNLLFDQTTFARETPI